MIVQGLISLRKVYLASRFNLGRAPEGESANACIYAALLASPYKDLESISECFKGAIEHDIKHARTKRLIRTLQSV